LETIPSLSGDGWATCFYYYYYFWHLAICFHFENSAFMVERGLNRLYFMQWYFDSGRRLVPCFLLNRNRRPLERRLRTIAALSCFAFAKALSLAIFHLAFFWGDFISFETVLLRLPSFLANGGFAREQTFSHFWETKALYLNETSAFFLKNESFVFERMLSHVLKNKGFVLEQKLSCFFVFSLEMKAFAFSSEG
jgi:hypothetical protein